MFLDVKPRRLANWSLTDGQDSHIIIRRGTNHSIRCNECSKIVWELCDGTHTLGEIMTLLAESFPDTPQVEEDVEAAIDLFFQLNAIEYLD